LLIDVKAQVADPVYADKVRRMRKVKRVGIWHCIEGIAHVISLTTVLL
jgi:hypothetical protein